MRQAYYQNTLAGFLEDNNDAIVGKLNLGATAYVSQWTISITSWESSIVIYKTAFKQLIELLPLSASWLVFLEYEIPRLASKIDAVIIALDLIIVIEFKLDRIRFDLSDIRQAEDYALDLHDFHLESHDKIIIPVLLAPNAKSTYGSITANPLSNVQGCLKANQDDFTSILNDCFLTFHDESFKNHRSIKMAA